MFDGEMVMAASPSEPAPQTLWDNDWLASVLTERNKVSKRL